MSVLSVLAAAAASWIFGAIYYMLLAKPWTEASGIAVDENGKPVGQSPLPFLISAVCMILVAGMMRHMFSMAQITTLSGAALAGLGVGAFFISPWIFLNNAYGMRPIKLSVIDAGYAICGATIMGVVLTLI